MSKETITIPTEEYINLCSYRRIIEDKENVYQRVVVKEDGVTRCETMQVFAPEEYQQRVEEWCAVYNGGKDLNVNELRELYSLRSRIKDEVHQYNNLSKIYYEMCNRYLNSSGENAILESECKKLRSKMNDYYFWKSCSITLFLILCVLFYIMAKSNL